MQAHLWVIPTKIEGVEILQRHSWTQLDKHKYFMKKNDKQITLLFSGTGSVALTLSLTEELAKNKYSAMFFLGFAGAYTQEFSLGELVEVRENLFGDVGTSERTLVGMGLPFSYKKEELNTEIYTNSRQGFRELTYNKVSETFAEAEARRKRWQGHLESMEGAAFFVLGKYFGVPFRMFRAISNYAGEQDKKNWKISECARALWERFEFLEVDF